LAPRIERKTALAPSQLKLRECATTEVGHLGHASIVVGPRLGKILSPVADDANCGALARQLGPARALTDSDIAYEVLRTRAGDLSWAFNRPLCLGPQGDRVGMVHFRHQACIDLERWRHREWSPAFRGSGIDYRRVYDCRHTFATWAIRDGIPPSRSPRSWVECRPTRGHLRPLAQGRCGCASRHLRQGRRRLAEIRITATRRAPSRVPFFVPRPSPGCHSA
jgi:hypothetical protein